MKKIIVLIVFSVAGMILSYGQSPQKFNYQAIARDATGNLIANQAVMFRISILQGSAGGTVVYQETHSKTTNTYGQATLAIGAGTVISGTFSSITWASNSYYIKTEMDPTGGTAYVLMGTTQLLSVPYALYSNTSGGGYTAGSGIGIAGTTISNTAQNATHTGDATGSGALTVVKIQGKEVATTIPTNGQVLKWNLANSKWEPSTDNSNTYTAGTGINVAGSTISNTAPDQTVTLSGGAGITTSGTYPAFTIANSSPNATHTGDATGSTALTVVKIQGQAVSSAIPATDQVLKWNGTQWTPSNLSTPSSGWLLTGNGGINPASNFLGTTDNNPLVFRVNNQMAGKIDNFSDNTSIGYKSLNSNISGHSNVAYGSFALYQNTNRNNLVAIGDSALFNNGTGASAVLEATRNTAIGSNALRANTIGSNNTATGFHTMKANTIGWDNTAHGAYTLNANTTGSCNTANGSGALLTNITGKDNTATGTDALRFNTTGNDNTANGMNALYSNTTGYSNTAYGNNTLYLNTTKNYLVAIGDSALFHNGLGATTGVHARHNTAVGSKSLLANTIGQANTAIGYSSLYSNTTGSANTATGAIALFSNTEGISNTASGWGALHDNTLGMGNTATGSGALFSNTDSDYNTANGLNALHDNTGEGNTANGANALTTNTDGYNNTASGMSTLYSNTSGSHNTATGSSALYSNTTGFDNTANGDEALKLNTTGSHNTAIGGNALYSNKANSRSIAIGYQAMLSADERTTGGRETYNIAIGCGTLRGSLTSLNNTGRWNTAVGDNAMYSNSSGNGNTATGVSTLFSNTTGSNNVAFGDDALLANTTGTGNSAYGSWALVQNTYGSYNTAVGKNALYNNIGANGMTCIGFGADVISGYMDDATAIGLNAIVNANGKTRIGDVWQNTIEGEVGWSTPADGMFKTNITEDVKGLEFIKKLRPVTYNDESRKFQEFLVKNMPDSVQQRYFEGNKHPDINPIKQTGFIAQEVEIAAKAVGYNFDGVHVPVDENDNYSLVYGAFVVPLVKGMQEQQLIIDKLQLQNEDLQRQINEINALLKK